MHELSVAQEIVEIVVSEAKKKNALKVSTVTLEVGELSGVETDALHFAWNSAVQDTLLDRSLLKIDAVKGKAICGVCHHEYMMSDLFELCPFCESFRHEIVGGKELKIKSFEIEY